VARATTDEHGLAALRVVLPSTESEAGWLCAGGEFEVVVMPEPSPALVSNDDRRPQSAEEVRRRRLNAGGARDDSCQALHIAFECLRFDRISQLRVIFELFSPSSMEMVTVASLPPIPVRTAEVDQMVDVQPTVTQRSTANENEVSVVLNTTTRTPALLLKPTLHSSTPPLSPFASFTWPRWPSLAGTYGDATHTQLIGVESTLTTNVERLPPMPVLMLTRPPPRTLSLRHPHPLELQLITNGGVPLAGHVPSRPRAKGRTRTPFGSLIKHYHCDCISLTCSTASHQTQRSPIVLLGGPCAGN
jgi:hypothetical protein